MNRIWNRGSTTLGLGLLALGLATLPTPARAAGDAAKGKVLFEQNCVSCHGATGEGNGPVGATLNPPPRNFVKGEFKFDVAKDGKPGSDADLHNVIKNGAAAYGGSPMMAPWGFLGDASIDDLVAYIRTFKK